MTTLQVKKLTSPKYPLSVSMVRFYGIPLESPFWCPALTVDEFGVHFFFFVDAWRFAK